MSFQPGKWLKKQVLGGKAVTAGNILQIVGKEVGITGSLQEVLPKIIAGVAAGTLSGPVVFAKLSAKLRTIEAAERPKAEALLREQVARAQAHLEQLRQLLKEAK